MVITLSGSYFIRHRMRYAWSMMAAWDSFRMVTTGSQMPPRRSMSAS